MWYLGTMFVKLVVLFITWPMVEILILIKLGDSVGFWPTVLMVIGTGIVGAALAKLEGYRTWFAIQEELNAGRLPADKLIDALLLFVAGIFLITPGLLSDIAGILLLIPGPRNYFKRWIRKKFDVRLRSARGEQRRTAFTWIPE